MEYVRLGQTGLKVSRLALGCMSFGERNEFHQWTLDEESSQPYFRQARGARDHLLGHGEHVRRR